MRTFLLKVVTLFLIVFACSAVFLPLGDFVAVYAGLKDAKGCDVQPNESTVYGNTKLYPFIRNNGDDLDPEKIENGDLPPEGYEWEILAIQIKREGVNEPRFRYEDDDPTLLGTIKTRYKYFMNDDDERKATYDSDKMIMDRNGDGEIDEEDAVKARDFPNDREKYDIVARDPDEVYKCSDKGDAWPVNSNVAGPDSDATATASVDLHGGEDVDTAFGPFPTTPWEFANRFVAIAIGVAGGVSFLLMIYGSFRLMFAAGNPESVQQGRQIITAAIVGLIVVLFSVFLLRLIGVSILGLPI
jgi:hypothetical protein